MKWHKIIFGTVQKKVILPIFGVPRHFVPWHLIFQGISKSLQGHWLQCPDIVLTEFRKNRLENVPHSLAHTIGFYPYEAKWVKIMKSWIFSWGFFVLQLFFDWGWSTVQATIFGVILDNIEILYSPLHVKTRFCEF